MRTQNTTTGAGTPAALPMLSSMLDSLLDLGSANRKPKTRRKIIAVMPDGSERTIYNSRYSGWNLPDGRCFTSHLASAKHAWIAAGATIKTINA
jgi:hypothetical protein